VHARISDSSDTSVTPIPALVPECVDSRLEACRNDAQRFDRLSVQIGDRVTWTNLDIVPHTATTTDGSWDGGEFGLNESVEIVVADVANCVKSKLPIEVQLFD